MERLRNKRYLALIVLVLVVLCGVVLFRSTRSSVVNPNKDTNLSAEEGRDYAALYQHGDLFLAVDENEDVMSQIRADIMSFARKTRPEFANKETLVGFTFDKESDVSNGTHIYSGHFYGLGDKIEIALTPRGKGVYTLSITNLRDGKNIDDQLGMNGRRNQFIRTLPIEKPGYSIRYQLTHDRIVVSFYEDYTSQDIDEVTALLASSLGDQAEEDVIYSINRVGIVPIERVRENLTNPLPQP